MSVKNLYEIFKEVNDFRRKQARVHKLEVVCY